MSAVETQVDLTSCDREPIHQLGHIQSFGAMLVVSSDHYIAHHSANAAEFLGLEAIARGDSLDSILPELTLETIRDAAKWLVAQAQFWTGRGTRE